MLSLCAALASPAFAQQTPAGTRIVNTASLAYGSANKRVVVASNTVALAVDAVIDVAVVAQVDTLAVKPNASAVAVAFVVTNLGNARETFALAGASGSTALKVALDGDGAGEAVSSVTLNAGIGRTVFVIVPGPVVATIPIAMTATANSGHGTPGGSVAGAGGDGGDAVIGTTGGSATAFTTLIVDGDLPTLNKSQSVVAPDGSARAMPGSIVTYQLEARFPAATRAAAVTDEVPVGTIFVAGSMTLDGVAQTDSTDADAATFDGSTVRFALGDVTGAAVRTIRFQTKIK